MSLSHRKNPSADNTGRLECPSCGYNAMVWEQGTAIAADGVQVPGVTRWVCTKCKEELYDKPALAKIQAARHGVRIAA